MNIAIVFPGQGSQSVGMGSDLYSAFSSAKEVFEEVNDALSQNLSHMMFEGPEAELNLTYNTQPAIMTVGIAVLRVLQKECHFDFTKHHVSFAAGHSLGEYTALCAVNSLSLADTAKLLFSRGSAMHEAVPNGVGGMISLLGSDLETAEKIAKEASDSKYFCEISNDNTFGQTVLSGHNEALAKATTIAKEKYGVKLVMPLNVSAPFHCSLMQPAAAKMTPIINAANFLKPQIPVISNLTATPTTDESEIKSRLIQQITGQVKWRESVLYMQKNGIDTLIEMGSGEVLTRMKKRIAPELNAIALNSPAAIESFMKTL